LAQVLSDFAPAAVAEADSAAGPAGPPTEAQIAAAELWARSRAASILGLGAQAGPVADGLGPASSTAKGGDW
ncbi:MAG: hypothetical protein LBH48_07105, partial [Bifidobacteriaceae bacterium]|nr:hypothetical protein [Bifidobacteriaceae bacterium]